MRKVTLANPDIKLLSKLKNKRDELLAELEELDNEIYLIKEKLPLTQCTRETRIDRVEGLSSLTIKTLNKQGVVVLKDLEALYHYRKLRGKRGFDDYSVDTLILLHKIKTINLDLIKTNIKSDFYKAVWLEQVKKEHNL